MLKTLPLQISQAIFRVCQFIKQKDLKARIESYGVYLLESASAADFEAADKGINILEKLIFLGEEIGEIHYHHAKILHGQFANLKKAIVEEKERQRVEIAIADIFLGDHNKYTHDKSYKIDNANMPEKNEEAVASNQAIGNISSNERQELIAERIRQLGKAAMKDIIAAFTDVSHRTLRYDLQKLCDSQIIERIGNGGPASHYQIKRQFIAQDLRAKAPPLLTSKGL